MPRNQDDPSYDPEQELRQRLINRQTAQQPDPTTDPGGSSDAGAPSFNPAPSAPFEQSPQPAAPPAPSPTMAPPSDQINPNVRGSDMGPGGITGTTPTGISVPTDPRNRAGATPGQPTAGGQSVADVVNQWMATNNPYGHQDASYWINKINQGGGLANIDYWHGRFLENPNSNPHTPQGQPVTAGQAQPFTQPSAFQSYGLQAPQGLWSPDFVNQLRAMIQQRLTSASQPVDPNDPTITGTVNAARDEATRASETERSQLAERLYAQGGLNTDQLTQQVQQSGEKTALGLGSLKAQLIQREVQSRRTELQSVMQMALAAGDSQMAREIQMQIAQLDAMLREEGMGIDLAKFTADLNQKAALAGLQG